MYTQSRLFIFIRTKIFKKQKKKKKKNKQKKNQTQKNPR